MSETEVPAAVGAEPAVVPTLAKRRRPRKDSDKEQAAVVRPAGRATRQKKNDGQAGWLTGVAHSRKGPERWARRKVDP